ncbi:radical SAM protein [Deltaproteobacteria bacterium]|nr:radical SAM protein [Deltaproteobacteria bacterium]
MEDVRHFVLQSFGCKVNQYESQALREAWTAGGWRESSLEKADVVCVNTCAVTAGAVADARGAIRKIRRNHPEARIIVTGCAARLLDAETGRLPGVGLVTAQEAKAELLHLAENPQTAPPVEKFAYPPFRVAGYGRSRAVCKVQDGCSHRCAYCIVPLTRGPSRSRAKEETLAEVRRFLAAGFQEIILNGINLAQYGKDFASREAHDFWDLVAFLETSLAPEWAGRVRLRLSSLEPGQLGAKALDILGKSALVAPHLHVSLQSGSRAVLRRMGRGHYNPDKLPLFFRELAAVFPRYGLGADILSGFPGETDDDAAQTTALVKSLPFTYAHIFPYSRRPGTPAAAWREQVSGAVKKERAAALRRLVETKKQAFLRDCVSLPEVTIAWEDSAIPGGVNEFYADCRFAAGDIPPGASRRALVRAKPVSAQDGYLLVQALEQINNAIL